MDCKLGMWIPELDATDRYGMVWSGPIFIVHGALHIKHLGRSKKLSPSDMDSCMVRRRYQHIAY